MTLEARLLSPSSPVPPPSVHPTAIPLAALSTALARLEDWEVAQQYAPAFLVLLASAPQPVGQRPRITWLLEPGAETSGKRITNAALPLLGRDGSILVGRSETCDIPIFDATVSKAHAIIERVDDGAYVIHDAGSRNGTLVDGVSVPARDRAQPVRLEPGNTVRFGGVTTVFVDVPRLRNILRALASAR